MLDFYPIPDPHHATSFLAANLMGKISIDPTKTSTSTSDANYVTSSDVYDERYLCDTPLSSSSCSCAIGGKGLVGSAGGVFPGSTLSANGAQTAVVGPLGIQGPVNGIPHPSFRFAQRVNDVAISMTDVTLPGQEKMVWDAKFRLMGPDGSLGSDYLPSSQAPIGGEMQNFHKLCSALNSFRTYKLKVLAGGDSPIDQTIVLNAKIVQPPELIDPRNVGNSENVDGGQLGGSMKAVGPRMYQVGAASDTVGAIRSSSFAQQDDGTMLMQGESRSFPSVTSTSFNCEINKLKNPEYCHKPPTVTIHSPGNNFSNFF